MWLRKLEYLDEKWVQCNLNGALQDAYFTRSAIFNTLIQVNIYDQYLSRQFSTFLYRIMNCRTQSLIVSLTLSEEVHIYAVMVNITAEEKFQAAHVVKGFVVPTRLAFAMLVNQSQERSNQLMILRIIMRELTKTQPLASYASNRGCGVQFPVSLVAIL